MGSVAAKETPREPERKEHIELDNSHKRHHRKYLKGSTNNYERDASTLGSTSIEHDFGTTEPMTDDEPPEEEHFTKRSLAAEKIRQSKFSAKTSLPSEQSTNDGDVEMCNTDEQSSLKIAADRPRSYETGGVEFRITDDDTLYRDSYLKGTDQDDAYEKPDIYKEIDNRGSPGEDEDHDEVYDENDKYNLEDHQLYNEGYTAGYNAGYNEAYAVAYKSYEDQLAQLLPDTKYQLTYDSLPKNAKKYWKQRYSLFKKFDQGVFMTSELWYSVTPEAMALFIAKFIQACNPEIQTVVDVCCGGGGNTIQFARRFQKVIAIDINDDNLYCTRKNCEVYGVSDNVELRQADWTKLVDTQYYSHLKEDIDLVFCSPPWGGPGYKGQDFFDLNLLQPLPIKELLISFFKISSNVVLFLPRNSNLLQLADVTRELLGPDAKCRILYTYCDGFIKGITALWGKNFMPDSYNSQVADQQEVFDITDQEAYKPRDERNEEKKSDSTTFTTDIVLDY